MALILDGRELSKTIRAQVSAKVDSLATKPVVAIVLTSKDESAVSYVNVIKKAAGKVGITATIIDLSKDASQDRIVDKVKELSADKDTNGIIIQTPVPEGIDIDGIRSLVPLEKDIDGANPLSAGKLFSGLKSFAPATAAAVIELIKSHGVETSGKHAVVVGRSRIVGKPVAHMLLDLDCSVTICHSGSGELRPYTAEADILVVAAGRMGLVSGEDVSQRTTVIDVGTNFDGQGRLVGDVDFDSVEKVAKAISPVPGGVGPVTTAILLRNTLEAYLLQNT